MFQFEVTILPRALNHTSKPLELLLPSLWNYYFHAPRSTTSSYMACHPNLAAQSFPPCRPVVPALTACHPNLDVQLFLLARIYIFAFMYIRLRLYVYTSPPLRIYVSAFTYIHKTARLLLCGSAGRYDKNRMSVYLARLTIEITRAVTDARALITLPPTPRKVLKAELLTFWLLLGSM